MKKQLYFVLICTIVLLIVAGTPVCASGQQTVLNSYTNEDSITLFVKDGSESIEKIYVGQAECDEYRTKEVGTIRTIVLIDNSLSIPEDTQKKIVTFLTDLAASSKDGDIFSIATFSKQLNWITRECDDYLEIKHHVEEITYVTQESYLMSAIYDLLDELSTAEEIMFTRVLVLADGSDHEKLGYTEDEFRDLLKEMHVPFYTIGCHAEDNDEALKRMFSFSRITNGRDYMLDEMAVEDILRDMAEAVPDTRLDIILPEALCDGMRKAVKIDYDTSQCSVEVTMPFVAVTPMPITTARPKATVSPVPEQIKKDNFNWLYVIIPVTFLALGVLILLAWFFLRRKRKERIPKREEAPLPDLSSIGHSKDTVFEPQTPLDGTELLGGNNQTELLDGTVYPVLCLQDIHDPIKQFEYPLQDRIFIGTDSARCQIVLNYNRYVSAVHCTVFINGDTVSVRDGSEKKGPSTNGTYVNDKRVREGVPLVTGSVLRLGELSFTVSFK